MSKFCINCEHLSENGCRLWYDFYHIRKNFDFYYDEKKLCKNFSERLPDYVPTILYGEMI